MAQAISAEEQWTKFLRRSLSSRIDGRQFESYAKTMQTRSPLQSPELCKLILSKKIFPSTTFFVDPRHLIYIQSLVSTNLVSLADILEALLDTTRLDAGTAPTAASPRDSSREPVDAAILMALARLVPTIKQNMPTKDALSRLMVVVCKWMNVVIAASDGDGMGGVLNDTGLEGLGLGVGAMGKAKKESVGELIAAIGENEVLGSWMKGTLGKDKKLSFDTTLPMFSQKFQNINPNLTGRLDALVPKHGLHGNQLQANMGLGMGAIGSHGNEGLLGLNTSAQLSRGGIYVFFNSLFIGLPLIDDDFILNYLRNRYSGDNTTAAIDTIVAVFDGLANAANRGRSTSILYRHFLVNKIPLILVKMQLEPDVARFVLQQAVVKSELAASMDPSMGGSSADNMMLDLPNDLKSEFLFACALHGLILEAQIQEVLREIPLQTMASKKYSAPELIDECARDPERIDRLLDEIDEMEGNSGAAAVAAVEVMRTMCENKETMSLRNVCNHLTRKPKNIDFIFLYVKPSYLLEPLCELLQSWRYDDDQGEYQPVYEEFGYILLLVLTIIHKFGLTSTDLGAVPEDHFIPQLLREGNKEIPYDQLKEEKQVLLGGWIKALFGDGEGISDELYSSCRPQDFFLLVPTLFFHILHATNSKRITVDTVKGGLEYLHLPFLIASQISAMNWLSNYLWETHKDKSYALKILRALLFPDNKLPTDVAETHSTIISITAQRLDKALKGLVYTDSISYHSAAEEIRQTLSSHVTFVRSGTATASELESWTSSPGGLLGTLRSYLTSLVLWSANPDLQISPPAYTHRLLLCVVQTLGAGVVMRALIDELYTLHNTPNTNNINMLHSNLGEFGTDVVVSLITAPTLATFALRCSENPVTIEEYKAKTGRIGLVEALRNLEEDAKLAMEDPARGDVIMKLARRVNAQLNVTAFKGMDTTMGNTDNAQGSGDEGGDVGQMDVGFGMGDDLMSGM